MLEVYEVKNTLEVLTEDNKVLEVFIGYKGDKGDDALINGYNTVTIQNGLNTVVTQEEDTLQIDVDLSGKVDKVTGKGLSTNDLTTELKQGYDNASSKAHTQNTDSKLLSPDKTKEVITTDDAGNTYINGNIYQQGSAYETHAEEVFTKDDKITLRDGATAGLTTGQYAGFIVKKYDGTNDGYLIIDKDGIGRIGDVGTEQPLATREETPLNNGTAKWNSSTLRFETYDLNPLLPYYQTKTTLDSTLAVGTIYQLGTLSGNLSFALPNPVGVTTQEIALIFNLDSNLRTLAITGTNFYPATLTLVINLGYVVRIYSDGTKWVVGVKPHILA